MEIIGALMTPAGREDPYALYRAAHALGPATHAGDGFVLVPGYDEANQVLRNPAFGQWDPQWREQVWDAGQIARPSLRTLSRSVLYANPPDHSRMRSLISSVFTPRRVAALEPAVAAAVDGLLDRLADAGSDGAAADFMQEFAYQLPMSVICDLMGIPAADRETFRALATELAAALDFVDTLDRLDDADEAAVELRRYFTDLVAERRARPQDDLITALAAACDADDSRLTPQELLSNLALLLIAGFETTTNLFGNGLRLLFGHPAVAAGLRAGAIPYQGFVEEVLRYDSPVQMTSRIALTDGLTVGGVALEKGWEAAVMIGAANRDPRRYQDPERFDPGRADISPLSFGAGAHFCVGSVLARAEAAIGFPALLTRFPRLAPAGEPTRNERLVLRGFQHMPVTVA